MKKICSIIFLTLILSCTTVEEKVFNKNKLYNDTIFMVYNKYNDIVLKENMGIIRFKKYWEVYAFSLPYKYTAKYSLDGKFIDIIKEI